MFLGIISKFYYLVKFQKITVLDSILYYNVSYYNKINNYIYNCVVLKIYSRNIRIFI